MQNDNFVARPDSATKNGLVSVDSTYKKQGNGGVSSQMMWGFSNSANSATGSNTLQQMTTAQQTYLHKGQPPQHEARAIQNRQRPPSGKTRVQNQPVIVGQLLSGELIHGQITANVASEYRNFPKTQSSSRKQPGGIEGQALTSGRPMSSNLTKGLAQARSTGTNFNPAG